jgi:hypothetical protein
MSMLVLFVRKQTYLSISLTASCLCFGFGQQASIAQALPVPQPLITQPVDEHRLTLLKGNTHPLAQPRFDLGTAPATLPMQRMLLVLKRSPEQEFSLRKLLDDQQDKHSASYHKWLSPEQFGKQFGPADSDMQTIATWLKSHGFEVGTTKGRTVLEFSGSASQVQEAFHTTIHRYVVNGEEHWANSSDPSIPTALAPAVAGVLTLHNFLKKPQIRIAKQPVMAKIRPGKPPEMTFTDGTHGMAPADFATIYNSASLFSAASPINGSDIEIGVIGRSDLYGVDSANEDVNDFRSTFGLGGGYFYVILNGPDPGDLGGADEAEGTLDTSWAGAVAPGATIAFVVSATTNTADGIDLSEVYIIENNLFNIMTESFSSCEAESTAAQAAGYSRLAEQAAAEGITYFVSTGDDGAEGCDDQDSETVATGPVSVNVLASTAFTVAVGGTLFNDSADPAKYWSATNTSSYASVLSYIPENVWNDSCLESSCASDANIVAGSGGASSYVSKPSWQAGVAGIPNDSARDLPDVVLNADTHDGYALCLEGSCTPNASGEFSLYLVGGTSASAPSFAGIMALIDQQMAATNPTEGASQGQANYILYKLASTEALSQCNASNTTTPPLTTCIFNDVTVGNNAVPGEVNYGLPSAQYQAGIGYDLASGLGSVNIANLVAKWDSVTFSPTTTTLTITESTIPHGSSVPFTVAVSPTTGTGIPTGDVSLLAAANNDAAIFDDGVGLFTLNASGSVASSTSNLPGGIYLLEAHYAGDDTYASSNSNWATVDVTAEASATTLSVLTINSSNTAFIPFAGGPFGSFVYLRADVAGASGHGTPTGNVNFTDTFGTIPGGTSTGLSLALNSGDSLQSGAYTATPNGIYNFDTGTHTISASYSGDPSFNISSTSPPISFTISPGFFASTGNVEPTVAISAPGGVGHTNVSVSYSTGFSGTINLACSGLPAGAACSFLPASITASGKATTTSSNIEVTTTAATTSELLCPRDSGFDHPAAWAGFVLFSIVLSGVSGRRRTIFLLSLVGLLMLVPGCGGGGGGSQTTTPPPPLVTPTPAGSYTIIVNATSGSTTYETAFTLVVE